MRSTSVARHRRGPGVKLTTLAIVAATGCWASHAAAQQVPFLPIDQAVGLPTHEIRCLHQSASGVIFAGSDQGLFAFDGQRFFGLGSTQGLPDGSAVADLASTRDGMVAIRLREGLYLSDTPLSKGMSPLRLHFSRAISALGPSFDHAPAQMAPWDAGVAVIEKGRLAFLARDGGVARLSATTPDVSLPDGTEGHFISVFSQGRRLWAGLDDGRLCRLGAQASRCLGPADGVPHAAWRSFAIDGSGVLLARSVAYLARISPATDAIDVEYVSDAERDHLLNAFQDFPRLAVTASGEILTSSNGVLVARDKSGWRSIVPSFDAHGTHFDAILLDQAGNLWVASFGLGVFEARHFGVWENWTEADGLSSDVAWQFAQAPGGPVWVTTDGGLDEISRSGGHQSIEQVSEGATFAVVAAGNHHVWRSLAHGGLSRLDTETGQAETVDLPPVNVLLHSGADLWAGTEGGLFEIDDRPGTSPTPRPVAGIATPVEAASVGQDGTLWMISDGQLLQRRADGAVTVVVGEWHRPGFTPYNVAAAGAGVVWVGGSGAGLFRVSYAGHGPATVTSIDTALPSHVIFSILADRRGWIWGGSDRGIFVFDGRKWVGVDSSSGLVGNETSQGGLFEGEDGSIWVATTEGISHVLDPVSLVRSSALRPLISLARIGEVVYEDRAVDYSRQPLVIQFGALGASSDVRFRYRLDGVDATWADTSLGEARYPSLPYGHHRFTVIAYNPLTHGQSAPATVMFRMRPPVWLYWPFKASYALAVGALVYSLWRLRYRYLLAQRRKLQQEVDRRTRELQAAQAALILQATRDSLTGLLTRGEIQRRLVEALSVSGPSPHLAIGLLDIDFFKRINDEVGHLAGDEILEEIGRRLNAAFLPGEEAGRYGGEEILIVLRHGSASNMLRMHELKFAICNEPFAANEDRLCVTCSIGMARARTGDSWKSLIGRADKALYRAKAQGRDRVIDAETLEPRAASR